MKQRPIGLKRAYEAPEAEDGRRFLVERLWPRGVRKADLRLDAWLKDVAPSPELRRWFDHDPAKWPEFKRRYFGELRKHENALAPLRDASRRGAGYADLRLPRHQTQRGGGAARICRAPTCRHERITS